MGMKVYKIELCVIDFDELGADAIKQTIESAKYPNYCISPSVHQIDERSVEWSDEHPLNKLDTAESAFRSLFASPLPTQEPTT